MALKRIRYLALDVMARKDWASTRAIGADKFLATIVEALHESWLIFSYVVVLLYLLLQMRGVHFLVGKDGDVPSQDDLSLVMDATVAVASFTATTAYCAPEIARMPITTVIWMAQMSWMVNGIVVHACTRLMAKCKTLKLQIRVCLLVLRGDQDTFSSMYARNRSLRRRSSSA